MASEQATVKLDDAQKNGQQVPIEETSPPEDHEDHEEKEEENDEKSGWLDILDNGDLMKFVLQPGNETESRPERGCKVTIKLITKIKDTDKIIASETFDKLDLILGDMDVIAGLDLVIPLMHPGEVARVLIAPRFAYGTLGKGEEIPPNTTLDCELHILDSEFLEEEDLYEIPVAEKLATCERKKGRGNFFFGRGDYSQATNCYKKAVDFLNPYGMFGSTNPIEICKNDEKLNLEEVKKALELRATILSNLAASQMKMEEFNEALESIDQALTLQPENVKALFRKGKILAAKCDVETAIEAMMHALNLDPENKAIAHELSQLNTRLKDELAKERDMYKRMF